jgi:hypothetical protein
MTGGTEIAFADGKFVVDDLYAGPIGKVTDGHPERFPFKDVMDRVSEYFTKDRIREFSNAVMRDHLSQFGLD